MSEYKLDRNHEAVLRAGAPSHYRLTRRGVAFKGLLAMRGR